MSNKEVDLQEERREKCRVCKDSIWAGIKWSLILSGGMLASCLLLAGIANSARNDVDNLRETVSEIREEQKKIRESTAKIEKFIELLERGKLKVETARTGREADY